LEEMERDITRLSGLEEAGTATAEERDMLESLILMKNIFDGQYIEARSELAGLIEDKKANYLEKREYKELKELYDSLAKSDESIKSVETSEVYFEEVRDRLDDLKRDGKATQPELEELNNAESKLIELKESKEAFLREREVLLRQRDEKNTYYLESSLERLMNLDEDNEATPEDREELLGLASLRDGIDAYAENSPDASPAEIRNEFKKLDEMSALKRDVRRERQLTKELEPALSRVNILRGMKADMIFTKTEADESDRLLLTGRVLKPDERNELEELKKKKEANLSIIRDGFKGDVTFTSAESERLDDLLKRSSYAENIEFERLLKKKETFENEIARIEAENKRMAEFGPKITTTPESELPLEIRKHYMRDKTIEYIKDASVSTLAFSITALPLFLKKLKCALGDFLCLVRTGKLPTASKSKK